MSKIFLSHASEEHELAIHLANHLEKNNLPVWYAPRNITGGEDYGKEIVDAIQDCRAVVLILSKNSDASRHVKTEIYHATKYDKKVICLKVDDVDPKNLTYFLGPSHRLNWLERRDETLDTLIHDIQKIPDPNPEPFPEEEPAEVSQPKPEPKHGNKIFLSFPASRRKDAVHVSEYLESHNIETWYASRDAVPSASWHNIETWYASRDADPGASWDESVMSAVKDCRAFLLLFSKDADMSTVVRSELTLALKNRKKIYWLKSEKYAPEKLEYFLLGSQCIEWNRKSDDALEKLVHALRKEKKPEPKTKPETKPKSGSLRKFLYAALLAVILILCVMFFMHQKPVSDDAFDVAAHGTPEQIQELINSGIDIKAENQDRDTLLITAAKYNTNPKVITELLRAGANILRHSGENTYGTAVFRAAQMNSNPEVLKVLLDAEDPSRRALILDGTIRFGYTLLGWAATMNSWNPQITRFLVEAGANVNAKNDDGLTAIMTSSMLAYNPGTLKILIDAGADVNLQDKNGNTALIYAQHEPAAMSEVLLNAGADANIRNNDGMTALMYSAMRNSKRWSTIKSLLNHGADKNIRDNSGKTAYDYALENEHFDRDLLPLLSPDVNVSVSDVFSLAEHGTPEEIQRAIDARLNFDVASSDARDTFIIPLIEAVRHNHNPESINLLLDLEGKETRDLILKGKIRYANRIVFVYDGLIIRNKKAVKAKTRTLLSEAAMWNNIEAVKLLLDSGADVNARNEEGMTALMENSYNPGVIKLLIDYGADINAVNMNGETALIRAVTGHRGYLEAISYGAIRVELLLDAGADVNVQDKGGKTALIHAADISNAFEVDEAERIMKLLITHGADKNIRDNSGKTAYDYALECKDFDSSLLELLRPDSDE